MKYAFCLLWICCSLGVWAQDCDYKTLLQKVQEALKAQDYSKAEQRLNALEQYCPKLSSRQRDELKTLREQLLQAKSRQDLTAGIGLILVPGGDLVLNHADSTLSRRLPVPSFYMSETEINQAQWKALMNHTNPSKYKGDSLPVEQVNWYEAVEFCNALSVRQGKTPCYTIDKVNKDRNNKNKNDDWAWTVECNFEANGYRLPTQAEWEYAARGGAAGQGYLYPGSDNPNEVAWHSKNSNNRPQAVKTLKANELKLYDMSGNLWEWCWDWYADREALFRCPLPAKGLPPLPETKQGQYRVICGGSWASPLLSELMPTMRNNFSSPQGRTISIGFRIVCKAND